MNKPLRKLGFDPQTNDPATVTAFFKSPFGLQPSKATRLVKKDNIFTGRTSLSGGAIQFEIVGTKADVLTVANDSLDAGYFISQDLIEENGYFGLALIEENSTEPEILQRHSDFNTEIMNKLNTSN